MATNPQAEQPTPVPKPEVVRPPKSPNPKRDPICRNPVPTL
jgi:hypothetical protein